MAHALQCAANHPLTGGAPILARLDHRARKHQRRPQPINLTLLTDDLRRKRGVERPQPLNLSLLIAPARFPIALGRRQRCLQPLNLGSSLLHHRPFRFAPASMQPPDNVAHASPSSLMPAPPNSAPPTPASSPDTAPD